MLAGIFGGDAGRLTDRVFDRGPLAIAATGETAAAERGGLLLALDGRLFSDGSGLDQLAAVYTRWGERTAEHLRGEYTALIWDPEATRGLLIQDHFGMRQAYLAEVGSGLAFATTLPALLELLPRTPGPDEVALLHRLGSTPLFEPRTLYQGVSRLGAAYLIELEGGRWRRRRYWAPVYRPPVPGPRDELAGRLREEMAAAVRRRVPGGALPGVQLSGGVDSSTVAGLARRDLKGPLRSYSFVFPEDPDLDESDRIDTLAESLRLDAVKLHVHPGGAVRAGLEYLKGWGLPLATPAFVLERALLDRADADGVEVMLDGQGGDEVFTAPYYLVADRLRRGRLLSAMGLMRLFPRASDDLPAHVMRGLFVGYGLKGALPYGLHRRLRARGDANRQFVAPLSDAAARRLFAYDDYWGWKKLDGPRWWANMASLTVHGRETSGTTEYMAMREHGLGVQVRSPMFDVELVETALSLPPEANFTRLDRSLIRESMQGLVPDSVRLCRHKSHLGRFFHGGLSGPDLPSIRALLGSGARVREHLDGRRLDGLLDSPPGFREPGWMQWSSAVWLSASAETWLRYLEDPGFPDEFAARYDPPHPRVDVVE